MSSPYSVRLFDRTTPPHVLTLLILSGVAAMPMNMFLPALPEMAAYFHTEYAVIQLSVSLYLASSAVLQLVVGPLSDRYGRRNVSLVCGALFLIFTLGCIYAPNVEIFLISRSLQAIVAAGMVLSRAVVRDLYAPNEAASMIGYVTMGMAVAPMISPALGGVLTEQFDWTASFWLLMALGILVLALVWFDMGETAPGTGLSMAEQVRSYPELLTSPRFWGYALASGFASGTFFAYLGGAPFVGTEIYGLSASELGFYFGAPAVGYFVGNYITGRFAQRAGLMRMLLWGCSANLFGTVMMALVFGFGAGSAEVFFALMTFIGLGNGMTIPNATAGMLSVRPHLAGTASGLGSALMLGGGAALGALAGLMLTPQTGADPLIAIMLVSALVALIVAVLTIRRERRLAAERS